MQFHPGDHQKSEVNSQSGPQQLDGSCLAHYFQDPAAEAALTKYHIAWRRALPKIRGHCKHFFCGTKEEHSWFMQHDQGKRESKISRTKYLEVDFETAMEKLDFQFIDRTA